MSLYRYDRREDLPFGGQDPDEDHFQSVEAFVEFMMDSDEDAFDWTHLAALEYNLRRSRRGIRRDLEDYGLRLKPKPVTARRRFRTIGDNPHDRWFGPGSSPTHGGSGWEQVTGFAGREG